jgi:hypothetical protein
MVSWVPDSAKGQRPVHRCSGASEQSSQGTVAIHDLCWLLLSPFLSLEDSQVTWRHGLHFPEKILLCTLARELRGPLWTLWFPAGISRVPDPNGPKEGLKTRDTRKDSGRKGMTRHMTRRLVTSLHWQIFIFASGFLSSTK